MSANVERILILLKPDAVRRHLVGEILRRIEAKGYQLTALRMCRADAEILSQHYAEHVDKPFYPSIVEYMTAGPLIAAVVSGQQVISGLRLLIGATDPSAAAPGTIRGDLGRDWGTDAIENLIHGSDSASAARREIAIWFPDLSL